MTDPLGRPDTHHATASRVHAGAVGAGGSGGGRGRGGWGQPGKPRDASPSVSPAANG